MKIFKPIFLLILLILAKGCTPIHFNSDNIETDLIIKEIVNFKDFQAEKTAQGNNKLISVFMESSLGLKYTDESSFENNFLHIGHDGRPYPDEFKYIKNSDYEYFVLQDKDREIFKLSNALTNKYKTSKMAEIIQDRKNDVFYEFLEFSKPYFSKNHQVAFIEVNYYSKGIYSDGNGYILEKTKNGWKIVRIINLWIT